MNMNRAQAIIDRHDRFMVRNYPRYPVAMAEGAGARLTGSDGREYVDLFSGFGAGILGHCHPDLVEAVAEQSKQLWHVGNLLHTEPQTLLAEQIASKGFGGRCFFSHSGSDANETAFKVARLYGRGERHKVLSTSQSFHGRGFASMMATGQDAVRSGFAPYVPGFQHVPYNDLPAMIQAVDDETVAIIVEPIQGEGGVVIPADDYLPGLRQLCDDRDLILIADEVWTGCGRTGKFFAFQHWPVTPDIMTLGKAVGAGLALGVTCVSERFAELLDFDKYGGVAHATTLGGNCLATAVANRLFSVLQRDGLVERADQLGQKVMERLRDFAGRSSKIKDVRGKGLFIGIELNQSEPATQGATVVQRCLESGVLLNATQKTVIRLAPPLVISERDIDEGLSVLEKVLSEA